MLSSEGTTANPEFNTTTKSHDRTTCLIMYGTMDKKSDANAAQIRNRPDPVDTSMPTGVGFAEDMRVELTDSIFLIMAVQMPAPIRIKRLPTIAKPVEMKKVKFFLATPLWENMRGGGGGMARGVR